MSQNDIWPKVLQCSNSVESKLELSAFLIFMVLSQSLQMWHLQSLLWLLHSLHLQFLGIQDLMRSLEMLILGLALTFFGSMVFQTIGPKLRIDPCPILTVRTFGRWNLSVISLYEIISFINGGQRLFLTLYISLASAWMLRWCMDNDLSISSSSEKELV